MAAAEHQRAGAVKSVEQSDGRRARQAAQNWQSCEKNKKSREARKAGRARHRHGDVTGRGLRRLTAKPQAGNTSERDRADLRNRCAAEQDDQRCHQGDGRAFPVGAERARHAPHGLRHDGHGD